MTTRLGRWALPLAAGFGWDLSRGTVDLEDVDSLKQPLPIYLVYFTAWEENGALQRVPDVYGLDRRHHTATASAR